MADFKSVLQVRVASDGSTRIHGEPPEWHVFPARWIDRELGRLARVRVIVTTTQGDVEYEMTGFERLDEDNSQANLSGWICQRVEG